jgi:hypothetical protein
MKISRNKPCPCGSGKKYKKCCLMKSEGKFWGQIENDINVQEIWAQHEKFIHEEKDRKERLGEVRQIISLDHKGYKFIPEDLQTELLQTVDRISKNYGSPPDPFNLITFTNHPHHYGDDNLPDPAKHVIVCWSENPLYKSLHPELRWKKWTPKLM